LQHVFAESIDLGADIVMHQQQNTLQDILMLWQEL
jgi:hypothetical protein